MRRMLDAAAFACALGAALSAPAVAFAEDSASEAKVATPPAGRDIIYLRDGGTVRGTIVELTPGVQARVRLETGEEVTVARTETMRIEHLSEPEPAGAAAYGAPAEPAAPQEPRGPRIARGSKTLYVAGLIGLGAGSVTAGFTLLLVATGRAIPCVLGQCATVSIDLGPAMALVGGGTAVALGGWWLMDASRPMTLQKQSALPPAAALPIVRGTF